jgi:hypothetical protein
LNSLINLIFLYFLIKLNICKKITFRSYFNMFLKKNKNSYLIIFTNYLLFYKNLFSIKTSSDPFNRTRENILIEITNKVKNLNNFIYIYIYLKLFIPSVRIRNLIYNKFFSLKKFAILFSYFKKETTEKGLVYLKSLIIIFIVDALLIDDEPLWEPVEWSLCQTWIFFIFVFAWIAENLIASRFGSFTGRDKRIWLAWQKTTWLLEVLYFFSYASAVLFVIVPFYYELTYNISFIFSWWNWYSRVFFFKFLSLYSLLLLIAYFFQINIRYFNWKKLLLLVILINSFIAYLLYVNFIMSFFGYFTNPLWYQKTRPVDLIQLSHEPLKWGWGPAKRDHFTYHKVSTVFWFKNDGPFAAAFLLFNFFFFFFNFLLYFYWLALLGRLYVTKELTHTFSAYCVSALKQFFFFCLFIYLGVIASFVINYWRFPIEFLWITNSHSWVVNVLIIMSDYPTFLVNLL